MTKTLSVTRGLNFFKVYFLLVTLLFIIFLVSLYFINSFLLNIVVLSPPGRSFLGIKILADSFVLSHPADTFSALIFCGYLFLPEESLACPSKSSDPSFFRMNRLGSILWLLFPLQNTFRSIIFLRILRGVGTYQSRRPRGKRDLQDRFRVQIFSCLQGMGKQKSLMLLHKAFGFYYVFLFRLIRQTFIYFVIFGLNGVGREQKRFIPTLCKLTLLD